jgi:predicted MFS family arabinose efflux permease
MAGTMLSGSRLGAHPRPLMIWGRIASAVVLACAMIPPLPGVVVAIVVALAMVLHGTYGVPSLMVLTAETPAGRAMTMTLNNSAISLGTAFGGMVGGLTLMLGGYAALGVVAPIFPLVGSGIIWWSRPRAAQPVLAAE